LAEAKAPAPKPPMPERVKARAARLEKKVAEMEAKLGDKPGDAKLRMFRKRMKRAQRRRTDFFPKKPAAAEGASA
jgi:hypothetical protein